MFPSCAPCDHGDALILNVADLVLACLTDTLQRETDCDIVGQYVAPEELAVAVEEQAQSLGFAATVALAAIDVELERVLCICRGCCCTRAGRAIAARRKVLRGARQRIVCATRLPKTRLLGAWSAPTLCELLEEMRDGSDSGFTSFDGAINHRSILPASNHDYA